MFMQERYPAIDIAATGRNIRTIMRIRGISVRDVQDHLGLSAIQSIYHWFSGRNMPTIDNLYALSDLLDIPIDAMVIGNRRNRPDELLRRRALTYFALVRS